MPGSSAPSPSGSPERWSWCWARRRRRARPAHGRASARRLLSAVTYALSLVLLRQRAQRDKFLHIVVFQNFGPFILVAPFGLWVWQPLDLRPSGLVHAHGRPRASSAICSWRPPMPRPRRRGSRPLEYTALIWAVLIGYGVFSEIPTWATLGGGILIVAAAMLTSRR